MKTPPGGVVAGYILLANDLHVTRTMAHSLEVQAFIADMTSADDPTV